MHWPSFIAQAAPAATGFTMQTVGLGAVGWVIQQLMSLRKRVDRMDRYNRHGRKLIAAKLGIPEADLAPPDEE